MENYFAIHSLMWSYIYLNSVSAESHMDLSYFVRIHTLSGRQKFSRERVKKNFRANRKITGCAEPTNKVGVVNQQRRSNILSSTGYRGKVRQSVVWMFKKDEYSSVNNYQVRFASGMNIDCRHVWIFRLNLQVILLSYDQSTMVWMRKTAENR